MNPPRNRVPSLSRSRAIETASARVTRSLALTSMPKISPPRSCRTRSISCPSWLRRTARRGPPLLVDPDLTTLPTRIYTLRPLRREALRAVIERPARLAGIEVDDELVDRLVDDTNTGEALPLLAFTLAQLAEGVTRGGRLSSARYDQLGGVQGP